MRGLSRKGLSTRGLPKKGLSATGVLTQRLYTVGLWGAGGGGDCRQGVYMGTVWKAIKNRRAVVINRH